MLQELQNQEFNSFNERQPSEQNQPEPELFERYEIKNWNYSPRLYKILAASAVFNILALLVFAQTNLLTTKGCDSPLVNRVCQVLDTVYVSTVLFGTDAEFVIKDYEKTELENADITYIDVSGETPPLNYPEGYFALANPEEFAMKQMMMENPAGFVMPPTGSVPFPMNLPSSSGTDLMNVTPNLPAPNNNAVIGELPTSPFGSNPIGKNPTLPRNRKFPRVRLPRPPKLNDQSPRKLPDLDDETAKNEEEEKKDEKEPEAKQPDITSLPIAEEIINKKPLQDFGDVVLDKVAAKKVDLSKPFSISMYGTITKDGKFDKTKSGYTKRDGDQEMIEVAKDAIEAIGDSGILTYLQQLGVETVNFELVQDDKQFYAVITSDQKSDSKAKSVSSGLNFAINIGKKTVKEADTLALLNAAKVESKGKNFVLNFKLDKPIAQDLIKRQLDKAQAKRQQQQSPQPASGAAEPRANQNSSK